MSDAEWSAWLARPIAERGAIQDKVQAALQAGGVQAGWDTAKANGMPLILATLAIPGDMLEARQEVKNRDESWEPIERVDH